MPYKDNLTTIYIFMHPDIEHDHNEYENARIRRTILDAMEPTRFPPIDSCSKYDPKDYSELEVSKTNGLSCSPIKVPILIWQGFIGCILACILHLVSCISSLRCTAICLVYSLYL